MLPLRPVLTAVLALALAAPVAAAQHRPVAADVVPAAATPYRHTLTQVESDAEWRAGWRQGTDSFNGTLRMTRPTHQVPMAGVTYDRAGWWSPWYTPGHGFQELVPSWNANTYQRGTWVRIQVRARTSTGRRTHWKIMSHWTYDDIRPQHLSHGRQEDALSYVAADTLKAKAGVTFTSYQWSVELYRLPGTPHSPGVEAVHAVMTQVGSSLPPTSTPVLPGRVLPVPAYSQMVHSGHYPKYGGGGEAWCSPTSLAMVLEYWGVRATASEYAWVGSGHPGAWVDETARKVYDYGYRGTGNWAFNTAYASMRLNSAMVSRLHDLRDVERLIAHGIPVIVSISFGSGQLAGAPLTSTPGHLVVVAGFTSTGDVVVNDPAAPTNSSVRRTYDRGQFEAAWLRRSHGLAYLMKPVTSSYPAGYVR